MQYTTQVVIRNIKLQSLCVEQNKNIIAYAHSSLASHQLSPQILINTVAAQITSSQNPIFTPPNQ